MTDTAFNCFLDFFFVFCRSEFSESESLSVTKTSILETSEFDDDTESCENESSVSYTETSFQPDSVRIQFDNLK